VNHNDHVRLLQGGMDAQGGIWADFGSGTGAFTLALADLIGESGHIYSIDRDAGALREQTRTMQARFPATRLQTITADFTRPLELPPLDGIVMANALHFVRDKDPIIARLHSYLKPGGRLLMVEYNVDRGNTWVPYPFSYPTWAALATKHGFKDTRLLTTQPSRFLGEIFSAVSFRGILPAHER
jgi:ubiquinone/menaquinone biosynthesis C-methylase UbiE